jgi:hypothetical protein
MLLSPWPRRVCPGCGKPQDGGPVVFLCTSCRRTVYAAHVHDTFTPRPAPTCARAGWKAAA